MGKNLVLSLGLAAGVGVIAFVAFQQKSNEGQDTYVDTKGKVTSDSASTVTQHGLNTVDNGASAKAGVSDSAKQASPALAYVFNTEADKIDKATLLKLINEDHDAYSNILAWLENNVDGENRSKLLAALGTIKNEEIIQFAEDLAKSDAIQNRTHAYAWLGELGHVNNRSRESLLSASYDENDATALKVLTTSLASSFDEEESAFETQEKSFARISEIAETAEDESLARLALKEVADRLQNPSSLKIIKQHLQKENTETKLNALATLRNFYEADKETRVLLQSMLEDPYETQEVKDMVNKVIWGFDVENK